MALPACCVKQAALCQLCSALLCNLWPITSSAVCSQAPGPGPTPCHAVTASARYVCPCYHCAVASSTDVCFISSPFHSAAPLSAFLWAQFSSPAGLWMEARCLGVLYAHPTGEAAGTSKPGATPMLLAPPRLPLCMRARRCRHLGPLLRYGQLKMRRRPSGRLSWPTRTCSATSRASMILLFRTSDD